MDIDEDMLRDEAEELARDALGDQADDEVLLAEVTEQLLAQLKAGWGIGG